MQRNRKLLVMAIVFVTSVLGPGIARAQHLDIMPELIGSQIVTGTADYDDDLWTLGPRVFHRDFGTNFANNNPGFTSIGTGSPDMPAGAQQLPGNAPLSWDFLPMTIGGVSSNLFYWNGQDTDGVPGLTPSDVAFGAPPLASDTLTLFDISNVGHAANDTNTIVPGGVIDTTGSDGFIHRHLFFFLQDNDSNSATKPADGLYLAAIRMRMAGVKNSLPVLLIFGTPNSSVEAEDNAAFPWAQQQTNLPGDYNGDGVVNAADYTVWRDTLGASAASGLAADGSGNHLVDQADYELWKMHFGEMAQITFNSFGGAGSLSGSGTTGVPEPTSELLFTIAIPWILWRKRRYAAK